MLSRGSSRSSFRWHRFLEFTSPLDLQENAITDLTPLQGMPLQEIHLTPKEITQSLDILRDMKSLKTIGITWEQAWPAAEFWERYDKGEFK